MTKGQFVICILQLIITFVLDMRYFIHFSYNGTAYHGWQIQPNGITVQEELSRALSILVRRDITVVGAGRTDAGVHARHMVGHFEVPQLESFGGCSQIAYKLNKMLPRDISVELIEAVADDMHARFSARSRTYHYYIHTSKDPFLDMRSWYITFPLDFEMMNRAAELLLGEQDFTSFSKTGTDTKTNLCNITEAHWDSTTLLSVDKDCLPSPCGAGEGCWCFTITANRFLRNMVRAIVGTLVEVGRGRITLDDVRSIIDSKNRCQAGESVPAHGLYLWDVKY